MTSDATQLRDRFTGCLLGLALGDALGAPFEGKPTETMRARYPSTADFLATMPAGELWYTDDTQMAIGVAQALVDCQCIDDSALCRRFAENYRPQRGYGGGARKIVQAMVDGEDHRWLAANHFPGGSFGNGAAMRVAPIGLFFHHDHEAILEQARRSSLPTHVHPLAIEGAQLLALAVGLAVAMDGFDRAAFFDRLSGFARSPEYAGPLRRAKEMKGHRDLPLFGNGIEAASSVVTSIACFSLTPDSFEQTVANAILLGGDTDTIAAMAGALSGAYLGRQGLPDHFLARLEDRHQGRAYLESLADLLAVSHENLVRRS